MPVYSCDFCCDFFSRYSYVASVNQRPFLCDSGATCYAIYCDFPQIAAKLYQVSNMFETFATACDKSRPNRTEIASSWHTHNLKMQLARGKNCTENRLCVNWPYTWRFFVQFLLHFPMAISVRCGCDLSPWYRRIVEHVWNLISATWWRSWAG